MAKNDDDLVKKYAAETAGMPPNLARIAARNLARADAQIDRLDVIRNRIAGREGLPPDVIASRYGAPAKSSPLPAGAQPGYYSSTGQYLGALGRPVPAGATGIVGSAAATPTTDVATARQFGYSGSPSAILAKPAAQRTPYERSLLAGYTGGREGVGVVGPSAPTFGEQAVASAPSFLGRVGNVALRGGFGFGGLSTLGSFVFPAVRSFLDSFSSRPRPYSPQPVGGARPSPTPSPNPYYADNAGY